MNWYKSLFYNSKGFFLLRTTSWLVGGIVGVLSLPWALESSVAVGLVASFMADIVLFRIVGFKESQFKNPKLLRIVFEATPQQCDQYNSAITWARPIVLSVIIVVLTYIASHQGPLLYVFCRVFAIAPFVYLLVMRLVIRTIFALKCGMVPNDDPPLAYNYRDSRVNSATHTSPQSGSWAMSNEFPVSQPLTDNNTLVPTNPPDTAAMMPATTGVPGFNTAGVYTGSSTAIGGISE